MTAYGGAGPFAVPVAAGRTDIADATTGFAASAARAREAGFDGVEVHGANGYFVDQFLTTYANLRDDEYGGDVRNRARLATEVVSAVRAAVGTDFMLGIRLSQTKVNDPDYRWPGGIAEAATIFGSLAEAGVDYLHLASEGRDWSEAGTLDGRTVITRLARDVTGLPIIANGGMHDAELARSVLGAGDADLVALGRGALTNPDWPRRLAEGRELLAVDDTVLKPDVTLDSQDSWERARGHGRPLGRP